MAIEGSGHRCASQNECGVTVLDRTSVGRCDGISSGEEMKFKAENLAEAPEKEELPDANWLRRGVQAAVKDMPDYEGQARGSSFIVHVH